MAAQPTPPASPRSDRIPPYSEEAERGVLGAVLLDPGALDKAVERGVLADAFYLRIHQELFEVLLAMVQEGRPVDLLTVGERLRSLGRFEGLGGQAFLEGLVDSTPTAAHAEYYIDIIRQKFILRSIIARSAEAQEACFGADEDADVILGKTEQAFFDITELQRTAITPWSDLINVAMEEIEIIFQEKKGITGVPTGYRDLDDILQGLQKGDMVVLAARPSMGKTSLALNIAENVALGKDQPDQKPQPVAVFSLEMSKEQLVRRMICSNAEVPSHKLTGGYLSKDLHGRLTQAASQLRKAPILLDDTAGLEVLELRSRARRMKRKHDIAMIVVDYLQMLHYPQFAREGRQLETAATSGALKGMAKELKVPVLVLSQLSRAPEQRSDSAKPRLSDLRDSGAIEQDADVVLLLRRPSRYEEDPQHEDRRLAYLEVAKHRNGRTGMVELNFEEELTRFENRTRGVDRDAGFAPAGEGGAT